MIRLLLGDCRDVLPTLAAESVQCCVTSPPYWGLRDYGTARWEGGDAECAHKKDIGARASSGLDGSLAHKSGEVFTPYRDICGKCGARRVDSQIGLEQSPDAYVAEMVAVFREVRRVLRDDGTCWLNLGDSYASNGAPGLNVSKPSATFHGGNADAYERRARTVPLGIKPKDLLMIPARVALALQDDGWWLRSDIIWAKRNCMPESVRDRPTSAHEHVFLLTKSASYYYDAVAIEEEVKYPGDNRAARTCTRKLIDPMCQDGGSRARTGNPTGATRNKRNVWWEATQPFSEAHFAAMPPAIAETCIKAGSRTGDTILDPFAGAGTTLLVADRLQRDAIGIELNAAYTEMAMERCRADAPLFAALPPAEPPEDERMADLFTGDEYQRLSPMPKPLQVPRGWDTGAGAHGTIHRTGRTLPEAAD